MRVNFNNSSTAGTQVEITENGTYLRGVGGYNGNNADGSHSVAEVFNSKTNIKEVTTSIDGSSCYLQFYLNESEGVYQVSVNLMLLDGDDIPFQCTSDIFLNFDAAGSSSVFVAGDAGIVSNYKLYSGDGNVAMEIQINNSMLGKGGDVIAQVTSVDELEPYFSNEQLTVDGLHVEAELTNIKQVPFENGDGANSALQKNGNLTVWGAHGVAEGKSDVTAASRGLTTASTDSAIYNNWLTAGTPTADIKFTLVKGEAAHAEGMNGLAIGTHSHVEGNGCVAGDNSAHAEGTGAQALGKYSHAEGLESIVGSAGSYSHAEGRTTYVEEEGAHSEGYSTKAKVRGSHAEGYLSETSKSGYSSNTLTPKSQPSSSTSGWYNGASHAEGNATIAQGLGAHSEGEKTFANSRNGHAEGLNTKTFGDNSHAEGEDSKTNTTAAASHVEGFDCETGGNYTANTKTTYTSSISGEMAHAEGNRTIANGNAAHSEGQKTLASGKNSHAEGYLTIAAGINSHAEGEETKINTTAEASHVEGYNCEVGGNYTSNTKSDYTSDIKGEMAHAEGNSTIANGNAAHSEGKKTLASGVNSHAEGNNTTANGNASHTEGFYTVTNNNVEHAEGKYNVSHTGSTNAEKTIHSVGIGTSSQRENAFEIMQNGDTYLNGVGKYDGTNVASADTLQQAINTSAKKYTIAFGENDGGKYLVVPLGANTEITKVRIDVVSCIQNSIEDAFFSHTIYDVETSLGLVTYTAYQDGPNFAESLFTRTKADILASKITLFMQLPMLQVGVAGEITVSCLDGHALYHDEYNDNVPYLELGQNITNAKYGRATPISVIDKPLKYMASVTWSNLKSLRDNGNLVPGMQYRITDYRCTTTQNDTTAATNLFDIIVVADSATKLNENARATQHTTSSSDYFYYCKLGAWQLKYCLDNDTDRFVWADTGSTGRGVVYWMKDEFDNEAPYDFKNIKFARWEMSNPTGYTWNDGTEDYDVDSDQSWVSDFDLKSGLYGLSERNTDDVNVVIVRKDPEETYNNRKIVRYTISTAATYCYTFGGLTDDSLDTGETKENILEDNWLREGGYPRYARELTKNVFLGTARGNKISYYSFGNTFGTGSYNNKLEASVYYLGGFANAFGQGCHNNIIGDGSGYNTFGSGSTNNVLGSQCSYNTFGINCVYNKLEDYCNGNAFCSGAASNKLGQGSSTNYFGYESYSNTLGGYNNHNYFESSTYGNTFGYECGWNTINGDCYSNTLGSGCGNNNFGVGCHNNVLGNSCGGNILGEDCTNNSFGCAVEQTIMSDYCSYNSFGNNCSYIKIGESSISNTFGNDVHNITFGPSLTATTRNSHYQYITVESGNNGIVLNTSSAASLDDAHVFRNVRICSGFDNPNPIIDPNGLNQDFLTRYHTQNDREIAL